MGHVSESALGCHRGHGLLQSRSDDIECVIRSIKEECLDRVIPPGEVHLRDLIREYMAHYHVERPHQGLDGTLLQPANDHAADGPLVKRERLGGLLNYYYREVA